MQTALTNRSYVIQQESKQSECGIENSNLNMDDNSSLIRKGEEFIIACVKEHLTEALPKFPEDGVQAICNHLTSSASLANVASHIGLRDIVLCAVSSSCCTIYILHNLIITICVGISSSYCHTQ